MKFLHWIARKKFKAMRLFPYLTLYTAIKVSLDNPPTPWLTITFIVAAMLGFLFESKFGIPGEADVAWRSCGEWQQFKKEFAELKKHMMKTDEEERWHSGMG